MLASITPLGERGRRQPWIVTVLAFGVGATAAGALLGAALGGLGAILVPPDGASGRLIALAAALAVGATLDRAGRVPGPRRQVDERWLDQFRGWVYGLGFGAQLGVGIATVITSSATLCAIAAALLVATPASGALILGLAGALRGLTPLLAAGVRTPPELFALHSRIDRWRRPVLRSAPVLLSGLAAASLLGAVA